MLASCSPTLARGRDRHIRVSDIQQYRNILLHVIRGICRSPRERWEVCITMALHAFSAKTLPDYRKPMPYTPKALQEAPGRKNDSKADTVNSRDDSAPHLLPPRYLPLPPLRHLLPRPQPPRPQPLDRIALHPTAPSPPLILHLIPDTPKCWHHLLQENVLRSSVSIFHFFLQMTTLSTVYRRRGRDLLACWARN